jgi:hypothetical protein
VLFAGSGATAKICGKWSTIEKEVVVVSKGSMPGEYRGGRQPKTPNRRTILVERIIALASEYPNASSDELIRALVRDHDLPSDTRIAVVKYHAQHLAQLGGTRKAAPPSKRAKAGSGRTTTEATSPVDAFFYIVQSGAGSPKARRKAALEAAMLLLPEKPANTKYRFTRDDYGFACNAETARRYRDNVYQLRAFKKDPNSNFPEITQKIEKLEKEQNAITRRLEAASPTSYGMTQIAEDMFRLGFFTTKRENGIPLTENESAEEAHRMTRFERFSHGAEAEARRRRADLDSLDLRLRRDTHYKEGKPRKLSRQAEADLRLLRRLYPAPQLSKPAPEEWDQIDERRAADHPFTSEEPDLGNGMFYAPMDGPQYVYSDPNGLPYSELPISKWPKTEAEFKELTKGLIKQGFRYF